MDIILTNQDGIKTVATVDGKPFPGHFNIKKRLGNWAHVQHVIPNASGIGATIKKVASISMGTWGGEGLDPMPNRQFKSQVEDSIKQFVEKNS